jgi:hypothetical protein
MDYMPYHVELCRVLGRFGMYYEALKNAVDNKDTIVPAPKISFQAPEDTPSGVKRGSMVDLLLWRIIPYWYEYFKAQIDYKDWVTYDLTQASDAIMAQSLSLADKLAAAQGPVQAFMRSKDAFKAAQIGARPSVGEQLSRHDKDKLAQYKERRNQLGLPDSLGMVSDIDLHDFPPVEPTLMRPTLSDALHSEQSTIATLVDILENSDGKHPSSQLEDENDSGILAFVQSQQRSQQRPYIKQAAQTHKYVSTNSSEKGCSEKPCISTINSILDKGAFDPRVHTAVNCANTKKGTLCPFNHQKEHLLAWAKGVVRACDSTGATQRALHHIDDGTTSTFGDNFPT